MNRQHIPRLVPLLAIIYALTISCASSKNDQAAQDHYDALEQQQLSELETEEQKRKFDLLRPARQSGKNEMQEQDRNQRYEQAVQKAESRRGNLDFGFADPSDDNSSAESPRWQASVQAHPVSGEPACMINSSANSVLHGELETRVQLIMDKNSMYLRTDATLDSQAEAAGFIVDEGELFPLEIYLNELTGNITERYQALLIQMALGQELRVSFRYLPQSETEANYVVRLALDGFTDELKNLNSCSLE